MVGSWTRQTASLVRAVAVLHDERLGATIVPEPSPTLANKTVTETKQMEERTVYDISRWFTLVMDGQGQNAGMRREAAKSHILLSSGRHDGGRPHKLPRHLVIDDVH